MGRFYGIFLVCILLFLPLAGCDKESEAQDGNQANATRKETEQPKVDRDVILVETALVQPHLLQDMLLLPGSTEARHDVRISSERAGRVEWVGPTEGDKVTKDEVIAMIDLSALQATLNRAQASYDLKITTLERRMSLFDRKVLSKEELDQARTYMLQAKSDLRTAQVEYEQGIVRSPIDGTVEELFR